MKQALALEIMLSGENVFLTGAAGSGKTFVLNQFIKLSKRAGKKVSVTATTGLAATHLGGTTIHSWSGMGIMDFLPAKFVENLSKGRREIIENTDTLIIDEISMLHDFRLDIIDEICRLVRKNDTPFGGIQVILCGDFFQLPPINRGGSRFGGFVVSSNVWQEMDLAICYLDENFRQGEDDDLTEILNALRAGDLRRRHAEKLLSRVDTIPEDEENLTELHTVNIDVDKINERRLEEINSDEIFYTQNTTGAKNYVETLQRSVLAPPLLRLKKGALVMAVKNAQSKQYVNGSIGKVLDFEPMTEYPVVKFRNGRTVTVMPEAWELRDGDKKRAGIAQIPLRLAYAITVHKSQGMTLDAAKIDLRKAFVEGMGYVALSRVRSLETMYLAGINRMALQVSPEAQNIDTYLRSETKKADTKFAHLEVKAVTRAEKEKNLADIENKTGKESGSSGWSEKIDKMREQYPNAYKPWKKSDDEDLKTAFRNGESVADMSLKFERHKGSIVMRLKKHFGEDVSV